MYFFNRRPRGFHYTMRFSNERRDLIDDLRRGVSPEVLARNRKAQTQHARPVSCCRSHDCSSAATAFGSHFAADVTGGKTE